MTRPPGARREEFAVVPSQRGGWPAVAVALARLADRRRSDVAQIVIVAAGDIYAQFILDPDGSVHAETVSNLYLPADQQLADLPVSTLHALGWADPVTSESAVTGPPNYSRQWNSGVSLLEVATECLVALFEVYGIAPTATVSVSAFNARDRRA